MQALYRIDDVVVTNELADGYNDGDVRTRWGIDGMGALVLVEDYDDSRERSGYRRQFLEEITLRGRVEPALRAFHRGGLPLTIRPAYPGVRLDRFLEVSRAERGSPSQELCLAVARALIKVERAEDFETPLSTLVWLGFDGSVTGLPALVPRYESWNSAYDLELQPGAGGDAVGVNLCRLVSGIDEVPDSAAKALAMARSVPGDMAVELVLALTVRERALGAWGMRSAAELATLPVRHPEVVRVLAGLFPTEHAAASALVEEVAMIARDVPTLDDVARLDVRYADELRKLDDGPAGFP